MAKVKRKTTLQSLEEVAPILAKRGIESAQIAEARATPWTPEERKALIDALRSIAGAFVKGNTVKEIIWIFVRLSVTAGLIWATYNLVQEDKFSSPVALFFGTLLGYMFAKESAD